MSENDYPEARRKLREGRKAAGKTLEGLANACGYKSASFICEMETGGRDPSFQAALAIERELGEPRVEEWGYDRETARRGGSQSAAPKTGTEG